MMAAARAADLDYLLLTDHDTLAACDDPGEHVAGKTALLVGVEVSPPCNHYLAYGISPPPPCRDQPPQSFIDAVAARGGVGFLAHPFDCGSAFLRQPPYPWTQWHVTGFTGIEVWNFFSQWVGAAQSFWPLLRALFAWRWTQCGPDPRAVAAWDSLGRARRVVGIGGVDAHGVKGCILGRQIIIHPYERSFRTVRTHLLLGADPGDDIGRWRTLVLDALGQGRCYVADWQAGDPRGFSFTAASERGALPMGAETAAGPVCLQVQAPEPCRISLLHDGRPLAGASRGRLQIEVRDPGVYRVEVRRGRRTWILANPIYLR